MTRHRKRLPDPAPCWYPEGRVSGHGETAASEVRARGVHLLRVEPTANERDAFTQGELSHIMHASGSRDRGQQRLIVDSGAPTVRCRLSRPRRVTTRTLPMTTHESLVSLVGNTPLLRLRGPSEKTGCEILGKCEFANPGQSIKDRAALWIIRDAESRGELQPGGVIVEGTAGNTGIGLCTVGNALGYRCVIVMPETQSQEKKDALRSLGADLRLTPAKPYRDQRNYIRTSKRLAGEIAACEPRGAIWANQFDNVANRRAHVESTGPEIWEQTGGRVDAFVSAIGTGGTLAGVGMALKERKPDVKIVLADPFGSCMHSWFHTGRLESEGSSISEGIGQGRVTKNIEGAPIDMSFQVSDVEMLETIYDLLINEGLCLGGSTGINVAGAMKVAREMGPGHNIVTLLCDNGNRYQSKIFNPAFLSERNLPAPPWMS